MRHMIDTVYSVIIPAYNEELTIERAIRETVRVFNAFNETYEIIVVDDGSTDETASIVTRLSGFISQLTLIRLSTNQGKGAAVRAGVERSTGEVILFLDADLATHPSEFKKFLPALQNYDIVIGSRTARGSLISKRQPVYRVLLGKLFNKLAVRWYLGLPFNDTQCGFKVFRNSTKSLFRNLKSTGWAFDAEILFRARQHGFRIAEIPVEWRHGRESRVRFRDVIQIAREILHIKRGSCHPERSRGIP